MPGIITRDPQALDLPPGYTLVQLREVGDAFALKLFTPFLMDVGFSKTEIGAVTKTLMLAASVSGAVVGGVWMVKLGLLRALLLCRALLLLLLLSARHAAPACPRRLWVLSGAQGPARRVPLHSARGTE